MGAAESAALHGCLALDAVRRAIRKKNDETLHYGLHPLVNIKYTDKKIDNHKRLWIHWAAIVEDDGCAKGTEPTLYAAAVRGPGTGSQGDVRKGEEAVTGTRNSPVKIVA